MRQINLKIVLFALVLGLFATASSSFACWGNWMGHGSGVTNSEAALTAEQQQQLDAVKEKYSQQLAELQTSLNKKATEYHTARNNDSTTVGTLKGLEAEVENVERQYWALLDQANNEAGQFITGNNNPWFNCGYSACNHQNHRGKMSQSRHMGPGHRNGMSDRHMACCWRN